MKQQQSRTQSDIVKHDSEEEDEEIDFNAISTQQQHSFSACFLVCSIIAVIVFIIFKITIVITEEKVLISIPPDVQMFPAVLLQQKEWKEILTSPEIILENLQSSYKEVFIQQINQEQVLKVEQLNIYHVQFKKTLRSIDYSNAHLILAGKESGIIDEGSSITYDQFTRSLGLLQLTTFPYLDFSKESIDLPAQQYKYYKDKWKLWSPEENICAIMVLSSEGLNSGNYYYSLRGLFQQRYTKFKAVIIDNTPDLGLQAEVLGLIKELSKARETIVIDRIKGQGNEASSIYYALHKYCKNTELTIITTDKGELIGQYAFSLINEVHQQKQVPLVISNYLLDSGNLFTNLQNQFRYKVPIYPNYNTPSKPRSESYKTKYLKSYKTQLLLSLPLTTFQNNDGFWHEKHIEAFLEFSSLEKACGKYFFLQQILYRVPKSQVQGLATVTKARQSNTVSCYSSTYPQTNPFAVSSNIEFNKQYNDFLNNLIPQSDLREIVLEDNLILDKNLILFDRQRISSLIKTIKFEDQNHNQNIYGFQLSVMSKNKVFGALQNLMMGSRVSLYWKSEMNLTYNYDFLKDYEPKIIKIDSSPPDLKDSVDFIETKATKQTSFCIILELNNNEENYGYFYSIESVVKQKYAFYRLIIIDNSSKDKTLQATKRHLLFLTQRIRHKVHFYGSKTSKEKGQNMYFASRMFCQAEQVIIFMSGGEELVGPDVLQKINAEYQNGNPLAVYSNNLFYDNNELSIGISHNYKGLITQYVNYRALPLLMGQLRTFKADLFYRILEFDFKKNEQWISDDLQFKIAYAILEMGCEKVKYLEDVLYRVTKQQRSWPKQHFPEEDIKKIDLSNSSMKNNKNFQSIKINDPNKRKYQCLFKQSLTSIP